MFSIINDLSIGDTISIDSDLWCDINRIYSIDSIKYNHPSTGVYLELDNGETRNIPIHWIKKV